MMPNINPNQMKRMMKKFGMKMDELDAQEVIIVRSDNTEIHVKNPQVVRMNVQGQDTFQITGDVEEGSREAKIEVDDEDIDMVVDQLGVTPEEARKALEEAEGDLAKAILDLQKEE